MIFDPITAVVFVGFVGASSLVRSNEDRIIAAFEQKISSHETVLSHRVVINSPSSLIAPSEMSLVNES
jgi:hypothetical protein